jgi:2'-5' RNA ligase
LNNKSYLESGNIDIDKVLTSGSLDLRRGISLIIPIRQIVSSYEYLVDVFSNIDPNQYYYDFNDLHITVFDFIHAKKEYKRNSSLENAFLEISKKAVEKIRTFNIELRGVVFSRSAGLIKGYDNNMLVLIRKNIRELMNSYNLTNDERYESESSHATFVRFRQTLQNPAKFNEAIENSRYAEFGVEEITNFELVEHDWYNSSMTKRIIQHIHL